MRSSKPGGSTSGTSAGPASRTVTFAQIVQWATLPSSSTDSSSEFALNAVPTEGGLLETPAGDDNPFLQNAQGSSSILSGASFTFSGGPDSIDSFGSSTTPSISFGGGLQSTPLTFGVGSNEQVFGSGADSGTFAGFGFMPTANDSAKADAKQSAADNGNAGDDGSAGNE